MACLTAAVSSTNASLAASPVAKPLPDANPIELTDFRHGQQLFTKVWSLDDGVGPLLNAQSCAACHHQPSAGGSGTLPQAMVPQSADALDVTGGHIFQQFTIRSGRGVTRRALPVHYTFRKPPALFGLGLLEAISDDDIARFAGPDDANHDGISGRSTGRLGAKGRTPTIEKFVAAALINELGLTNPTFPHQDRSADSNERVEVTQQQVDQLARFVRLLAPPVSRTESILATPGFAVFDRIGCAQCHRPTFVTGDSKTHALRRKTIHPFTDLLLHDMGAQLAEPFAEPPASEREFLTPPLWGIGITGPPYLHDGRAHSLAEAILGHGGEAETTIQRFRSLPLSQRNLLVQFLKSI